MWAKSKYSVCDDDGDECLNRNKFLFIYLKLSHAVQRAMKVVSWETYKGTHIVMIIIL